MKEKTLFALSVLLMLSIHVHGQSIFELKTDLRDHFKTKKGQPISIKYSNTYYKTSGKKKEKKTILFTAELDTIREQNYRKSKLKDEIVYVFDTINGIQKKIYRTKTKTDWKLQKTTTYKYNDSGLVGINTVDTKGTKLATTMIVNDPKKNPVKSTTYNEKGVLAGFESAVYNYQHNTWVHAIFNEQGQKLSEIRRKMIPQVNPKKVFNEQGDCILAPVDVEKNIYEITTYKYDKKGNWKQKKIIQAEKIEGKWKNKKKIAKLKRKIKYYE